MPDTLTGSCQCGGIRFEATGEPMFAGHCHCLDCRKTGGTGHGTVVAMAESGFSMTGTPAFYDYTADSGNAVRRAFCPTCGVSLYTNSSGLAGVVILKASALDDPEAIAPQGSVYASRALSWDPVNPDLPAFPEMPPE